MLNLTLKISNTVPDLIFKSLICRDKLEWFGQSGRKTIIFCQT